MEEWASVPTGSQWDRMKPLGSHMTSERTNRRPEWEFMTALKRGSFAGLGIRQEKCKDVLDREPTCKVETSSG
jgi:hypothetical protein